jgi:hypothetical protein
MMHIHYELRKQRYEEMLREAQEHRLVRELGVTEVVPWRTMAARFLNRLSQIISPQVTSREEALIRRTRGASQSSK